MPVKKTNKARTNLLKAVPNKAAYNKLSASNRKGFDAAAKKAGIPQKKVVVKKKVKKIKKK